MREYFAGYEQIELESPVLATRKAGANSHITFNGVYYSIPHTYYNDMVIVRAFKDTIDILDSNGHLIASHIRCYTKRKYITDPLHMPRSYRSNSDGQCYDAARLRKWSEDIGEHTSDFIDILLGKKSIEEQAYKSCMAVLQMSNKYGNGLLEASCGIALAANHCSYSALKKIIDKEYNRRINKL